MEELIEIGHFNEDTGKELELINIDLYKIKFVFGTFESLLKS